MATKSAAILLATLAIGVVLGMVAQGMLMHDRDRRVAELRAAPGFVSLVAGVIQPRPDQEAAIRTILEKNAQRYDSVLRATRGEVTAVLDSMKQELAPLLDERQRERLGRMAQVPDPNRPPPRPGERPPRRPPPPDERPPADRPPPRDSAGAAPAQPRPR